MELVQIYSKITITVPVLLISLHFFLLFFNFLLLDLDPNIERGSGSTALMSRLGPDLCVAVRREVHLQAAGPRDVGVQLLTAHRAANNNHHPCKYTDSRVVYKYLLIYRIFGRLDLIRKS